MLTNKSNRLVRVPIRPEQMLEAVLPRLARPHLCYTRPVGLPDDVRCVGIIPEVYTLPATIFLVLESAEFEEVTLGSIIPVMDLKMEIFSLLEEAKQALAAEISKDGYYQHGAT